MHFIDLFRILKKKLKKINQGPHNKQNIVFALIISASLHRVKMAHVQNGLALKWLMYTSKLPKRDIL